MVNLCQLDSNYIKMSNSSCYLFTVTHLKAETQMEERCQSMRKILKREKRNFVAVKLKL